MDGGEGLPNDAFRNVNDVRGPRCQWTFIRGTYIVDPRQTTWLVCCGAEPDDEESSRTTPLGGKRHQSGVVVVN